MGEAANNTMGDIQYCLTQTVHEAADYLVKTTRNIGRHNHNQLNDAESPGRRVRNFERSSHEEYIRRIEDKANNRSSSARKLQALVRYIAGKQSSSKCEGGLIPKDVITLVASDNKEKIVVDVYSNFQIVRHYNLSPNEFIDFWERKLSPSKVVNDLIPSLEKRLQMKAARRRETAGRKQAKNKAA